MRQRFASLQVLAQTRYVERLLSTQRGKEQQVHDDETAAAAAAAGAGAGSSGQAHGTPTPAQAPTNAAQRGHGRGHRPHSADEDGSDSEAEEEEAAEEDSANDSDAYDSDDVDGGADMGMGSAGGTEQWGGAHGDPCTAPDSSAGAGAGAGPGGGGRRAPAGSLQLGKLERRNIALRVLHKFAAVILGYGECVVIFRCT